MIVDVEDRDAFGALIPEPLRRNSGVVDVAIAAHETVTGMVSGRAAERESRTLAALHECSRCQHCIIGRLDRFPRTLDERRAAVEGIEAEQRVNRLWPDIAAQTSCRPGERQRRAVSTRFHPQRPD